ncbi:hypothetical protein HNY73_018997 [Argiope bruennichi]|uniref:Uncharacterized protein n=1 Tax=Argiope bruennichi TaxID=94029 RepID=A0A8T0EFB9_ARGBR|nr:hypothetical protein HNY73_018997 [Argiope bruennichi]
MKRKINSLSDVRISLMLGKSCLFSQMFEFPSCLENPGFSLRCSNFPHAWKILAFLSDVQISLMLGKSWLFLSDVRISLMLGKSWLFSQMFEFPSCWKILSFLLDVRISLMLGKSWLFSQMFEFPSCLENPGFSLRCSNSLMLGKSCLFSQMFEFPSCLENPVFSLRCSNFPHAWKILAFLSDVRISLMLGNPGFLSDVRISLMLGKSWLFSQMFEFPSCLENPGFSLLNTNEENKPFPKQKAGRYSIFALLSPLAPPHPVAMVTGQEDGTRVHSRGQE